MQQINSTSLDLQQTKNETENCNDSVLFSHIYILSISVTYIIQYESFVLHNEIMWERQSRECARAS